VGHISYNGCASQFYFCRNWVTEVSWHATLVAKVRKSVYRKFLELNAPVKFTMLLLMLNVWLYRYTGHPRPCARGQLATTPPLRYSCTAVRVQLYRWGGRCTGSGARVQLCYRSGLGGRRVLLHDRGTRAARFHEVEAGVLGGVSARWLLQQPAHVVDGCAAGRLGLGLIPQTTCEESLRQLDSHPAAYVLAAGRAAVRRDGGVEVVNPMEQSSFLRYFVHHSQCQMAAVVALLQA
jgi:hypothetical protein